MDKLNDLSNKIKKMIPIDKLKEYKVGLVYHFGSTASGYELKFSDIDLGIVFTDVKVLKNSLEAYTKLYTLFINSINLPYEFDIVLLQQTSCYFQYQIISEGKVIYELSPEFRVNYEEDVLNKYLDFKPIVNYFNKILIERLKA